jgi:hypothetical protein
MLTPSKSATIKETLSMQPKAPRRTRERILALSLRLLEEYLNNSDLPTTGQPQATAETAALPVQP